LEKTYTRKGLIKRDIIKAYRGAGFVSMFISLGEWGLKAVFGLIDKNSKRKSLIGGKNLLIYKRGGITQEKSQKILKRKSVEGNSKKTYFNKS